MAQNTTTEKPKGQMPALSTGGKTLAIVPQSFAEIVQVAGAVIQAGMNPKSLDTTAKCTVAIMHGLELGLTPMAALQSIAVVNGNAAVYGDGMLALVRASGHLEDITEEVEWIKGDPVGATCRVKRKGEASWGTHTFTRDDAMKANLWKKAGPWTQYPQRMLAMRARAWALRDKFADVLRGLRSAEEMEDMLDVTEQGSAETPAEPRRGDYTATAGAASQQTGDARAGEPQTPPGTPPRDQAGGQGQAGGDDAPAGGDKAKGSPAQPDPEKPAKGAKSKKGATVTDVQDVQPENPHGFEKFTTRSAFYSFSDTFLQSSTTTPAMARQWEEFYRDAIAALAKSEHEAIRTEINDTLGLLTKKLAEEVAPPAEREPGEEG
jgi:RecT family